MASAPAGWTPLGDWGTTKFSRINVDKCIGGVYKATDEFGCDAWPDGGHYGNDNKNVDIGDYDPSDFQNKREHCHAQVYESKTVGCRNVGKDLYINFATRGMY
jgi:hypothetical protein